MLHTCRAANLQYFMRDEKVYEVAKEMLEACADVRAEDRRGTRIREDFSELRRSKSVAGRPNNAFLDDDDYGLLANFLSSEGPLIDSDMAGLSDLMPLTRMAQSLSHLQVGGVSYKPYCSSQKDCNIIYTSRNAESERAGQIQAILRHTRQSAEGQVSEIFFFIRPFKLLIGDDIQRDHYRNFPWVGGRLYYDLPEESRVIIRPEQIVSHCAITRMNFANISAPCIHALPLDRVRVFNGVLPHLKTDNYVPDATHDSRESECI